MLSFFLEHFTKHQFLDWSKLKELEDDKILITEKIKFLLGRVENILGKGDKCWSPAFSPFPIMFSKGLCLRVVKRQDCVVK